MDVFNICAIIITAIIIILALVVIIDIINNISIRKKEYELDAIETRNKIELGAESFSLLDLVIDEELLVYATLNVNYKGAINITPKMEEEIRRDLAKRVSDRISSCQTLAYKLRQLYQYDLGVVIGERVCIRVMRYVIENNENQTKNKE